VEAPQAKALIGQKVKIMRGDKEREGTLTVGGGWG
jgi:hypothetical protein